MCDPVALFTPVTSLLSYKNKVCYLPLHLSDTTTVIYLYICETRQLLIPRLFVHGIISLFSVLLWRNSFVVPLTTTQCTGLIVCEIVLLLVVHLSFIFSAISAFLVARNAMRFGAIIFFQIMYNVPTCQPRLPTAEKWRPRAPVKLRSLHLDHVDCMCHVLE